MPVAARANKRAYAMEARDKILIKDLLLRGILGLNDRERKEKQDILINLEVFLDTRAAGRSDRVEDSLNYRTLTKAIVAHVEASSHYLVESLAAAVARIVIIDYGAERAIVRVEKVEALRFTSSVGVEIDRTRADFE